MQIAKFRLSNKKRRLAHYLTAFFLLVSYGGQVCPFLESLTLLQLSVPIIIILFIQYVAASFFLETGIHKRPLVLQSRLVFQFELGLFILGGVTVTLFNTIYFGFPMGSGAKLLLAMGLLGLFAAIDMSLSSEWLLSKYCETHAIKIDPTEHYFSQPKKLVLFISACSLSLMGVIFLIINKDLDWLISVGQETSLQEAQQAIMKELGFVAGVLLVHIFNLVLSYSRNFNHFLSRETHALTRATNGDFNTFVPVSTNDEFGIMAKHTNLMVEGLKRKTEELAQTRDVTILSLASLAETRDNETGNHILRTQRYILALAENLRNHPAFREELDDETISLLFKSAPLHDIGKVGIPDNILLKPGKLTDEEFRIMKRHPFLGSESLRVAEEKLGSNSFLRIAREISLSHHEKWDGSGYPKKLKQREIPFSGRLMAVADVYDALISRRVYKPAFSHDEAKSIILDGKGSHFDPDVVDAFTAVEQQFIQIAKEFSDS